MGYWPIADDQSPNEQHTKTDRALIWIGNRQSPDWQSVSLQVLHEVLEQPLAEASVAVVVLSRVLADLLLGIRSERLDGHLTIVGHELLDVLVCELEVILEPESVRLESE